ncbi:MAG: hypothetical protein ACFFA3_21295 [Promethearchaeota archaeon]
MIQTFIHELEKQISSNQELYEQTNLKIFKERSQKLETLMSEILTHYDTSHNEEFIYLTFNLRELPNKKILI